MARAASKKQAAQNAQMVRILTKSSGTFGALIKYVITELIAGSLALVLRGMAKQGDDLGQAGLTSYMFDIIYVTWFVHVTTAIISAKFWYTYLAIPLYAAYFAYTKILVPFVLGGRDPLAGLIGMFTSKTTSGRAGQPTAGTAEQEPSISKRQAKLQKRMEKGDPRVQARQQR